MSASPLEWTWTTIAMIGVVLSIWMIVDVYWDYRSVCRLILRGRARRYGPRWWIAVGALVGNSLTLLVWVGFFMVGVIAMQFPPPPPTLEQAAFNLSAGWILIAMETLLAITQIWTRFVRLQVAGKPPLASRSP